jgi:hypothetical protein
MTSPCPSCMHDKRHDYQGTDARDMWRSECSACGFSVASFEPNDRVRHGAWEDASALDEWRSWAATMSTELGLSGGEMSDAFARALIRSFAVIGAIFAGLKPPSSLDPPTAPKDPKPPAPLPPPRPFGD